MVGEKKASNFLLMDAQEASPKESTEAVKAQTPQPSSVNIRLWRPAAQRNLRNQWSKLATLRRDWLSISSTARSHATSLVNSYLSHKYMDSMALGVLSDMPNIRKKASLKLFKQQELQRNKLLGSYKDMVGIVTHMVNVSRSMRCYTKGASNSSLTQFSCFSENQSDAGDGGGIPVFTFWPISHFEKVAEDFIQMFISELNLRRLLVRELVSMGDEKDSEINILQWSDEFYPGEFEDLSICNLYSEAACEPILPSPGKCNAQARHQKDRDVLQVYLTTWISEVNIDQSGLEEIFATIGAEMHVTLS